MKCEKCGGMGTILNHLHQPYSGQQTAGMGKSVCPSCNGSGKSSAAEPYSEEPVSGGNTSFNAWAYLITWCILFYLTYEIYVPFMEMIFGKNLHVSELVKWLNIVIMMVPPTVIVYLFRRFIPGLFALSIIIGILGLAYGMIKN